MEWVLRCKAMELESLRCIVRRLERVMVVRPTYVLFCLETQSPNGHLNIYTTFVLSSMEGEELLEIIWLEVLNVSLLFNQTWLNKRLLPNHTHTHTHTHTYIYIYIYIYIRNKMCKDKLGEQAILNIIVRHTKPSKHPKQNKLIIYYTKFRTPNLNVKHNINFPSPVSWGCRTYRLLLCRGVRLPQRMSCIYDVKPSLALEIWGMWRTPLLPLLQGPLWPGVVAPGRVLFTGQIELFDIYTDCKRWLVVIRIIRNRTVWAAWKQMWVIQRNTWNHLTVYKRMINVK